MTRRVFLIDDNLEVHQTVRDLLAPAGYEVSAAKGWDDEAEGRYHRPPRPDLVLIDLHLGDSFSGDLIVRAIRSSRMTSTGPKSAEPKLILFSNLSRSVLESRAQACGADGFILKDALSARGDSGLLTQIERQLGLHREVRALSASGRPRLTILVVDDNKLELLAAKMLLEREGHEVVALENWANVNETLFHQHIDLALVDVLMPRVAGDALVKILKRTATGKKTPLVLVSNLGGIDLRARALESGADDWVQKPLTQSIVRNLVEKHAPRSSEAAGAKPGDR